MQSKCSQNSVKIQSKFSKNATKLQSKCSQNAAKMQPKFSQNAEYIRPFRTLFFKSYLRIFLWSLGNLELRNFGVRKVQSEHWETTRDRANFSLNCTFVVVLWWRWKQFFAPNCSNSIHHKSFLCILMLSKNFKLHFAQKGVTSDRS